MTPENWIQLLAALPPTLLALASLLAVIKGNANVKASHKTITSQLNELANDQVVAKTPKKRKSK